MFNCTEAVQCELDSLFYFLDGNNVSKDAPEKLTISKDSIDNDSVKAKSALCNLR
jgi:hypothetical protein